MVCAKIPRNQASVPPQATVDDSELTFQPLLLILGDLLLISGNLTESHKARIYLYSVCLVLICNVQVFYNAIQLLVYTIVGNFVVGCCCCITQQKLIAAVAFCTVCLCVVYMDNDMRVYSMNPILVFCSVDCMRTREVHLTGCA